MSLLNQNEKEANRIVAKVMRITFIIFTLIYILNVIGVFVVDNVIMTIAYIGGSILLLVPTLLVNILKQKATYVKYVNVICATIFVMLLCATLTFHVVVIYVYPIAIASLYFSKMLNIVATAATVLAVSVGQILAFTLNTLPDDNFPVFGDMIIYGIVPRALVLIAIAAIFTMLCSRTASLLSNLMGAEEQKEMLDSMTRMKENAENTSKVMSDMVSELSEITQSSLQANQSIAKEAESLLTNSTENTEAVESANSKIHAISEELEELSRMNHTTAKLTDTIEQNIKENQNRMNDATDNMEQIYKSTGECKEIISNLGEESKQIIGIVQTITGISSRTNMLALNATIEAARAGEHGKGFVVVAEEIQKLSEQTKNAVENIGAIVDEVVKNTESAVKAMEKNVLSTQAGMESIKKANESTALITSSNEELTEQIHEIDKAAESIKVKSGEVSENMNQINNNTGLNCNAVEHISAVTQENSAGTESLAGVVEKVKELSEQLDKVVRGN